MFYRFINFGKKRFSDLSQQEILALAISAEEDDARIYESYANSLRKEYPDSAQTFDKMAAEEHEHRRLLIDMHREKFGETIPLIRREHVKGFYSRAPDWLSTPRSASHLREKAVQMELQAKYFYQAAAQRTTDASIRKLLGDLAEAETGHIILASNTPAEIQLSEKKIHERQLLLTYVQPGLAGLMDGSVSTLAPIFATAFATQDTHTTFLVGLAASVGAGISMGFTEAASDDGKLTGRGSPAIRGMVSGIMTTLGGLGHALPYLITDFWTATVVAFVIVIAELWIIALIQSRYMQTPFLRAALQVILGGALVLAAGVLIGQG